MRIVPYLFYIGDRKEQGFDNILVIVMTMSLTFVNKMCIEDVRSNLPGLSV